MNRRTAIQSLVAASIIPFYPSSAQTSPERFSHQGYPISIILPKKSSLPDSKKRQTDYEYRLSRAILDFIQEYYSGDPMPVWDKRPDQVDLEKRVVNIVYWIMRAVKESSDIYPIEPAWILAQIMEESFFYEYSVSWAFAVGICQFMMTTAMHYGMICPSNSPIDPSKTKLPEKSKELERYLALKRKRRKLIKKNRKLFYQEDEVLRQCLSAHLKGESLPEASKWLQSLEEVKSLEESINQARRNYRQYLLANYTDKSIFNQEDLKFFLQFDHRVTYHKPIKAMVKMMAEHMRGRNGNLLAATAGYNAGLPNTSYPYGVYQAYGRIPPFRETVKYVSKIVVNHHEIVKRL